HQRLAGFVAGGADLFLIEGDDVAERHAGFQQLEPLVENYFRRVVHLDDRIRPRPERNRLERLRDVAGVAAFDLGVDKIALLERPRGEDALRPRYLGTARAEEQHRDRLAALARHLAQQLGD